MMTTTLNGNVLTVVTPIAKELADQTLSPMIAKDENGNEVCRVTLNKNGQGSISSFGIECNTVVDGKLALQLIVPMNTTLDEVKAVYGKDLVEVSKWIDKVAENVEKEIAAVDAIFVTE